MLLASVLLSCLSLATALSSGLFLSGENFKNSVLLGVLVYLLARPLSAIPFPKRVSVITRYAWLIVVFYMVFYFWALTVIHV